jgi:hypothetical protein
MENNLIYFLPISGYSQLLHFYGKNPKKLTSGGQGGSQLFFLSQISCLSDLKPHAKFRNHTITPSWRKVTRSEREKMPLIVDT